MAAQDDPHRRVDGGRGRAICDLEVDDLVLQPARVQRGSNIGAGLHVGARVLAVPLLEFRHTGLAVWHGSAMSGGRAEYDIQIAARFVLRVGDGHDVELRKGIVYDGAQVSREVEKGVVITLRATRQLPRSSRCGSCGK